jgi:hypothetical protein
MDLFQGNKMIAAKAMTLGEYNEYRGWKIPENEDPAREGYLVEYIGNNDSNHPNHKSYISWSPKQQFDDSHVRAGGPETLAFVPFIQRLLGEQARNADSLDKLHAFQKTELWTKLPDDVRELMARQEQIMFELQHVLNDRVELATNVSGGA